MVISPDRVLVDGAPLIHPDTAPNVPDSLHAADPCSLNLFTGCVDERCDACVRCSSASERRLFHRHRPTLPTSPTHICYEVFSSSRVYSYSCSSSLHSGSLLLVGPAGKVRAQFCNSVTDFSCVSGCRAFLQSDSRNSASRRPGRSRSFASRDIHQV